MVEISKRMSREYGFKSENMLYRLPSKSQKTLNYNQRSKNLQGKIRLRSKQFTTDKTIVLIDDVFTTGATVNECARILKNTGYKEVYVCTIAID